MSPEIEPPPEIRCEAVGHVIDPRFTSAQTFIFLFAPPRSERSELAAEQLIIAHRRHYASNKI